MNRITSISTLPPVICQSFYRYLLLDPWLSIEESRLKWCVRALRRYKPGSHRYRKIQALEIELEELYGRTKVNKTLFKEKAKERSGFSNATLS